MTKLAEWCAEQPAWISDALRRAAVTDEPNAADISAIACRVGLAHGVPADGEHPCEPYKDDHLRPDQAVDDDVLLCSVGPLEGVDRLLSDQELQFALDGLTVVFGDNGSGKSGYARALRRLCQARVPIALQGDVFATGAAVERRVTYKFKKGDQEAVSAVWTDGQNPPAMLAGITMIDTENARVYVAGDSEILFLPPEIGCLTRLGKLYTSVSERLQTEADVLSGNLVGAYGEHLSADTAAGKLVRVLVVATARADLPTDAQLEDAAIWTGELEAELSALEAELALSPAAIAAQLLRVVGAVDAVVLYLKGIEGELDGTKAAKLVEDIAKKKQTKATADVLADEQIGGQPIAATGSESWKTLFGYARTFAAEAELRQLEEPFAEGDPCPLCQQALGPDATQRLAAFDKFIEGKANTDATEAAEVLAAHLMQLEALPFRPMLDLQQVLAEFAARGDDELALATQAVEWSACLLTRRDSFIAAIGAEDETPLPELGASPIKSLEDAAAQIRDKQQEAAAGARDDDPRVVRVKELRDQRTLHDQLAEIKVRRGSLDRRLGLLECVTALNTAPISRLATSIRKDLVTPELSARIVSELKGFGLGHIPLEFKEASRQGTSFFEMALATPNRADKSKVLSEGEQRALSLACFLADNHISSRKSAIIFDDPVTSLDHQRMRRVAQRLVLESAKGRQIIVFTHNILFYQELLRACADANPQIPALPCLVRQSSGGEFGRVTVNDEPWIAKKVSARERALDETLKAIPDDLPQDDARYRKLCTSFYAALRETWERLVEEVLLNGVVERFGTDVGTLRLRGVEVTQDDHKTIYFAMKRASEYSGHDQAGGRQIDVPDKAQMRKDLQELIDYRLLVTKRMKQLTEARKALEEPPKPMVA